MSQSPAVFQLFKQQGQFRKVERAKELLRSTPDSVSAIASALGFLDVSYFVKLFKRFEGVTPLTYRKLKRSSSAAPSLGKI